MKGAGINLRLFHVGTCLYKIYVPFVEIFSFFSIKELLSIWCIYPKTVATRRAASLQAQVALSLVGNSQALGGGQATFGLPLQKPTLCGGGRWRGCYDAVCFSLAYDHHYAPGRDEYAT